MIFDHGTLILVDKKSSWPTNSTRSGWLNDSRLILRDVTSRQRTTSYHFNPTGLLLSDALSGCDTTSVMFGMGKMKTCNLLSKALFLRDTFCDHTSSHGAVKEAREAILRMMYSGEACVSLEDMPFITFQKLASTQKVKLARLSSRQMPPNFTPTAPTFRYKWGWEIISI